MSRVSFDDTRDSQTVEYNSNRVMQCQFCGAAAPQKALVEFGARCAKCYEAYCRAPQLRPKHTGDKDKGPLSWAHALKLREEEGESMSQAQRDSWRAALGPERAEVTE